MSVVEIIAAAAVGALLFAVGYELGGGAQAQDVRVEREDPEALEERIQTQVEAEVTGREREVTELVISQIEELLTRRPQPRPVREVAPAPAASPPEKAKIEWLEGELDTLISEKLAAIEKKREEHRVEAESEERRARRREPFDAQTLRKFEEARKKMLEERRRLREKEEKRSRK